MKMSLAENEDFKEIYDLIQKLNEHNLQAGSPEIFFYNSNDCEKLDLLIINKKNNLEKINQLIKNLNKNGIIILNIDEKDLVNKIDFANHKIITYGFNGKATVTTSSVCDDECKTVQCCIQRVIQTFSGKQLEQQEFSVMGKEKKVHNILAFVTIALYNDNDIDKIKLVF